MPEMSGAKFWSDLRSMRRDTVMVTELDDIAALGSAFGMPVVHIGSDARNHTELGEKWSELTYRSQHAWILTGQQQIAEQAHLLNIRSQVNTNTGAARSQLWIRHTLQNLPHLLDCPPAQSIRLPKVPAFIVGPGPSLAKNVSALEAARAKGIVIAVNAASKACRPHAVLTLEANDLSHKLEPGVAARLYALGAPPKQLETGTGPLYPFWAGEPGRWVEELTGVERVICSASGSTAAVSLAYLWGCDPIVLVGHDLAFDPEGLLYAVEAGQGRSAVTKDGSMLWDPSARRVARAAPLPTEVMLQEAQAWGCEGTVQSSIDFDQVAMWMSAQARNLGGTWINATEGGRHIDGWRDEKLTDVLKALPIRPTERMLEQSAGQVCLDREQMRAYLSERAVPQLAEAWAMPYVVEENARWRATPRFNWLPMEAWACWRRQKRLDRIEQRARRELIRLCEGEIR